MSARHLTAKLYWPCWAAAVALTGIVAGLMLGNALILARFLDWLLTDGAGGSGFPYPLFRGTAGRAGVTVYYAICGVQIISVLVFFGVAIAARRASVTTTVAAIAGTVWVVVHYVSGFGALEAAVLKTTVEAPRDAVAAFVRLNVPMHVFHAAVLVIAVAALLSVARGSPRSM